MMDEKTLITQYLGIVQKIARAEHRRIPNHMIEYEELVSIGIIAVQILIKGKAPEQLETYNEAYIGTAVRWAIRNELRHRYKWYTLKHKPDEADSYTTEPMQEDVVEDSDDMGFSISPAKVREAVYETILSIDELAEGDNPQQIKDNSMSQEDAAELSDVTCTTNTTKLVTICDMFDAMVTPKPYRKQMKTYESFETLQSMSGVQIDKSLFEALSDTIKEANGDLITRTLDREALRIVQTPQGFKTELIKIISGPEVSFDESWETMRKNIVDSDISLVSDALAVLIKEKMGMMKFYYHLEVLAIL